MRRNRSRSRRGATAAVAAVSLPVLLGAMALAVDAGLLRSEGQRAQVAADAASYAALRAYDQAQSKGADPMAAANAAASQYVGRGFSPTSPPRVAVSAILFPPSTPPARYAQADLGVQVTVTTQPLRLFSGIFGGAAPTASASSTSVRVRNLIGGSIILLNPSVSNSLSVSGGTQIGSPGPNDIKPQILVKSTSTSAGNLSGDSDVYSTSIKIAGDYVISGYAAINGQTVKSQITVVQTGVDPASIVDPLAGAFSPPSTAGLPTRTAPSGWKSTSASNPLQLSPGVYGGGLTFAGGMFYAMAPGVYYLNGGFNLSGGATVTASGVTIYLNSGNFAVSGGSAFTATGSTVYLNNGGLNFSGGTTNVITAPASGPFKGVAIIQNPTKNSSGVYPSNPLSLSGGAGTNVYGTIYAPGAALTVSGGTYTYDASTRWVADTLNISGGATLLPRGGSSSTSGTAFHLAQ